MATDRYKLMITTPQKYIWQIKQNIMIINQLMMIVLYFL